LLKFIGSPFAPKEYPEEFQAEEASALYFHAIKNRIPLLCLDTLEKMRKSSRLERTYRKEYSRYLEIFDTMAKVSAFLDSLNVEHAIFKSIRPYPDASVDIDTLIFDSEKYEKVVKSFSNTGCKLLGYGPQSTTFFDPRAKVGIDLYREIAVSWVVYLDKRKLQRYISRIQLPNKTYVSTLILQADLTAIIAHSVIKEQIYTLAEFYTFLTFLKKMKIKEVEDLAELIKMNNLIAAAKSFVSTTLVLHKESFGFVPAKLEILLSRLGRDGLEEKRLEQNGFQMPHKYHVLTLVKSVMDKFKEKKTRKSMALQAFKMMDPHFTKSIVSGFIDHIIRETY
jgi:hypothetical protein